MNLREETDFLLKKYQLRASKSLGQNFLINDAVISGIVEKAEVTKEDLILEIGPGLGSLTAKLAENAGKVIAIELDDRMITVLKERFSLYQNVEIVHEDVLKVNLAEMIKQAMAGTLYTRCKVVANLPYYITTPILMKLLEDNLPLTSITIMVQKEVGERLVALPNSKEYGAITVSVNYYATPSIVIHVPKEDFLPAPEVDSCVVQLLLHDAPACVANEKMFFRVVKSAFTQRRKNIGNSLTMVGKEKAEIKKMLEELALDVNLRAENLSLEEFARIANYLSET